MTDEMVMRSVYLRPVEDAQLRQLAHELNVTKSDLIRSAIGAKLREWLLPDSADQIARDLQLGRRGSSTERQDGESRRKTTVRHGEGKANHGRRDEPASEDRPQRRHASAA